MKTLPLAAVYGQISEKGISRPSGRLACARQAISERKLPVENDELILRGG